MISKNVEKTLDKIIQLSDIREEALLKLKVASKELEDAQSKYADAKERVEIVDRQISELIDPAYKTVLPVSTSLIKGGILYSKEDAFPEPDMEYIASRPHFVEVSKDERIDYLPVCWNDKPTKIQIKQVYIGDKEYKTKANNNALCIIAENIEKYLDLKPGTINVEAWKSWNFKDVYTRMCNVLAELNIDSDKIFSKIYAYYKPRK